MTQVHLRDVDVPSRERVVRAASEVIGGPVGRYARLPAVLPWQPAAAVLSFVGALMLGLGMFQKGYCTANGWTVPETFYRACYSDLPFLFANTGLAQGHLPYPAEGGGLGQPVGTGLLMWAVALLVPEGGSELARQRWYVLLWGVVLVILLALLVRATAQSCRRNPWRAAHVAASPLIVTTALVSPDLFGVMLASYALLLWGRARPLAAGVVFGLAICARSYPVLLLLVVGLLAARAGRLQDWAGTAGAALLTIVAVQLPALLITGGGSLQAYRTWLAAGPDYGSIWYLPRVFNIGLDERASTILAVAGWMGALLAGVLLALGAAHRPTIGEVSLVVVGIVLLTGKALPLQSSLWLLPLIALAGLRWRDHLVWVTCELCYFVAMWLFLGGLSDANRGLPLPWLAIFSMIRLCGIGWLVVAAWRRAWERPPAIVVDLDLFLAPLPDPIPGADVDALDPDPDPDPAPEPVSVDEREVPEVDELAGVLAGRRDQLLISFS